MCLRSFICSARMHQSHITFMLQGDTPYHPFALFGLSSQTCARTPKNVSLNIVLTGCDGLCVYLEMHTVGGFVIRYTTFGAVWKNFSDVYFVDFYIYIKTTS